MRQSNERGFLDAHPEQSFKNVPNDYSFMSVPNDYHGNADVLVATEKPARASKVP